ncbi:hypothetical protein Z046_00385 [Pseudomonas aeruginosa VRFPA09]|nr:hypothetical protein Z046_00385 [Pseudomonas aeruginosa VRFPA09]
MDGTRGRVDEAVVRQAIHWLVRLRSQPADDRLQRACAAWRAEHVKASGWSAHSPWSKRARKSLTWLQ